MSLRGISRPLRSLVKSVRCGPRGGAAHAYPGGPACVKQVPRAGRGRASGAAESASASRVLNAVSIGVQRPTQPSATLYQFRLQSAITSPHFPGRDAWGLRPQHTRPGAAASAKQKGPVKRDEADPAWIEEDDGEFDETEEEMMDGLVDEEDSDADFQGPQINTNGVAWGEQALKVAEGVLQQPSMDGLELYSFYAVPASKVIRVRLDKLQDEYGSPSLEDITAFARAMTAGLEEELGEEAAGEFEVEVSSPGAERVLRLPGELSRFQQLPLRVEYEQGNGNMDTRVLCLLEYNEATQATKWGLADVAVNKRGKKKGQGLSRKERDMVFDIPLSSIRMVRVHLEI